MQRQTADEPDDAETASHPTRRTVLRGTAAGTAALVSVPTLSGVAAAHFPHELSIDVQPQNEDNYLDLRQEGAGERWADDGKEGDRTVTVAVSPSTYLDHGERTTFDPIEEAVRYRFGSKHAVDDGEGARPVDDGEVVDVEGHDGTHQALVLEFPLVDAGFDGGEETGWLLWEREEDGEHGLSGVDSVRVVGGERSEDRFTRLLRRILRTLRDI